MQILAGDVNRYAERLRVARDFPQNQISWHT